MGVLQWMAFILFHPVEFCTLLRFKLFHEAKLSAKVLEQDKKFCWDRPSMRRCWEFLDMTSRSFSGVIKLLDDELARAICLFYLVLRGLDTVEDDMTIPDSIKQPLLRNFHLTTVQPGWNFDGSGPEKDRQLLVEYHVVVAEVKLLAPSYKNIILDICRRMGNGMADFTHRAAQKGIYLSTVEEYDLYCHYVAGLVGEGLSRIFSASGKEAEWLGQILEVSNSMGLLLQKTNIIRDYREDIDVDRRFWPQEIWGKQGFKEMKDMHEHEAKERAQWVQSGIILDALRHTTDALDYLRYLKNKSIFKFCAIPAVMAIATLDLCFMNPDMFQKNIKIRRATAAELIMRAQNPREVSRIFQEYARKIHAKAVVSDPYFLQISVACGKIEQWCEQNYPSFAFPPDEMNSEPHLDARTRVVDLETTFTAEISNRKNMIDSANGDRKPAWARVENMKGGGKPATKQPASQLVSKTPVALAGLAFSVAVAYLTVYAYT